MVENHFKTINKLKHNELMDKFRCSIVPLVVVNRLISQLSDDPTILPERESQSSSAANLQKLNLFSAAFLITKVLSQKKKLLTRMERMKIKQCDKYKSKMKEYEEESMKLAPKVENRIVCVRSREHYEELLRVKEAYLLERKQSKSECQSWCVHSLHFIKSDNSFNIFD